MQSPFPTWRLFLLFLFLALFSQCRQETPPVGESDRLTSSRLGEAHLEVTGDSSAIPHFEKGLLLLHSFEYADAREAFQAAQAADSSFAMAYWGEAITHHHPLWRQQAYAEGRAALARLGDTPEARQQKAATELERDLLKAVDLLYGEGDKFERDKRYADFLGHLYKKYPGNQEVAAFYALSLLGSVPVGRDEAVYEKGAKIAEGVLQENPNHPGALHYLIHSYDDPGHAHLAKMAADSYAEVAPDAAHALHMPSHIYVALGMWDQVVASNIDSYQASVARMERKNLSTSARSYHAFHWLMYGYLQQEKQEDAAAILRDMVRYTEAGPTRGARDYLIHMKANYLVETGDWQGELAGITVDERSDINIASRAVYAFTEGMKAFREGNADSLSAIIAQLEKDKEQASYLVADTGVPMCSSAGSNGSAPNKEDLNKAEVIKRQLQALEALSRSDTKRAEKLMQEAVALQDGGSYSYGPPDIPLPTYEQYADWLLDRGRVQEAAGFYDRSLNRGPKRVRALRGKLKAARQLQDQATASEVQKILDEIAGKAEKSEGYEAPALPVK